MEEEYQAPESRIPKWALIAGVAVVFLCLALLLTLFLARAQLVSFAVKSLASDTPIPSNTLPATSTFTASPTDTEAPTVAPTDSPPPTEIPMPPSEVMAISQGGAVLTDSFNENTNNWQGFNAGSEVIIQEQQLQLRSSDTGKPAVGYCQGEGCGPFENFYYYQADIVEDRPSTLALGLVFGINQPRSGFYNFGIRPASAEFSLQKYSNGLWQDLIGWTPNSAIKYYPFVNKIGVSYLDGNIQLYANGVLLSSYTDNQPYKSGRIGFAVGSDGVRLLASNVMVMNLAPVTPAPPSAQITVPAGATQPSAYQTPTPALRFTPTPTRLGACPAYVPSGVFVVIVFKSGPRPGEITINGSRTKVEQGNNIFYLPLKQNHVIIIGNRTTNLYTEACKIVNLKMNQ